MAGEKSQANAKYLNFWPLMQQEVGDNLSVSVLNLLPLSQHLAKFSGQKSCVSQHLASVGEHMSSGSRDIMYLTCHVTPQDHIIEVSCECMGGSSSPYVTTLTNLVTIGIVIVEISLWPLV